MGRTAVTTGWPTAASAARWGRWATFIAVTVPILYALTRWAWALGIPLGVTREFLREQARDTPDIWLAGAALATLAVGGATLTLGLVQPWGEVYPRWIPVLRGKSVRPRTAIIPASLVAVLQTVAGLEHYRAAIFGYFPEGSMGENWGTVAPRIPVATVGPRPWCPLPTPITFAGAAGAHIAADPDRSRVGVRAPRLERACQTGTPWSTCAEEVEHLTRIGRLL